MKLLLSAHKECVLGTPAGRQRAFLYVLETIELLRERYDRPNQQCVADKAEGSRMAVKIFQYLHDNAARDIGMPQIAAFTGLSMSTVFRLFKAHTGLSPNLALSPWFPAVIAATSKSKC